MSRTSNLLRYAPKKALAAAVAVLAVITVPALLFAWGPERPTYTIEDPADHVTFNSITDNPVVGDERNFVRVREVNASNETYSDSISLKSGHEYVVFVYYHNNASSSFNKSGVGVAKGAYVKVQIPAVVTKGSTGTKAVGYVGASNATPAEVWDNISFTNSTSGDIALRYVPGSSTIHNFGKTNGTKLSDTIVSTGAALGYDSLNGVVPGCEEFAGYVTLRVKADQPNFTIKKQVRKSGDKTWVESVSVKSGESVDFLISYNNTGTTMQNDVVISDVLPTGLTYVTGSTYVVNPNNPSGIKVSDNIVTASGINIGNYGPGTNAFVKFTAKVTAAKSSLKCGNNVLNNVATVKTKNGSKQDNAKVTVSKVCKETPPVTPPKELPKTGVGESIAAIAGLGALVSAISYYRSSRKFASHKR